MKITNSKFDNSIKKEKLDTYTLLKIYSYLWKLRIKPVLQEYNEKHCLVNDRSDSIILKKYDGYIRAINYRVLSEIENMSIYTNIYNSRIIKGHISQKYIFSSGYNHPCAYK